MRRSFMLPAALVFLLLVGGTGTATIAAQTPTTTGAGDLVVLDIPQPTGTEVIRFIAPASGSTWDWPLKQGTYLSGAAAGPAGVVYAGIADGRSTTVYEVDTGSLDGSISPARIGAVSGRSIVWKRSADGAHLFVLTFAGTMGEPLGLPSGLSSIALPSTLPATATTGSGAGDGGLSWYAMVSDSNPDPTTLFHFHLKRATLSEGHKPAIQDLHSVSSPYYSLIPSPAGDPVYLVDYGAQTIQAVNANGTGVRESVTFGDHYFKRPPCAAALSPDGNHLYLLGNAPPGILTYDTRTLRRIALFDEPGGTAPSYCLGVSRDGQHLFVTSDDTLVTLDARTGAEMGRKTFDDGEDLPRLVLTTSAGA